MAAVVSLMVLFKLKNIEHSCAAGAVLGDIAIVKHIVVAAAEQGGELYHNFPN